MSNPSPERRIKDLADQLQKAQTALATWFSLTPRRSRKTFAQPLSIALPRGEQEWARWERGFQQPAKVPALKENLKTSLREEMEMAAERLNRGGALAVQALLWRKPKVGAASSDLAPIRGKQWRLVVLVAGLELILDTLFPRRIRPDNDDFLTFWLPNIGLEKLAEPVSVPRYFRFRRRKIQGLVRTTADLRDFFGMRDGHPWKSLSSWWLERQPIQSYRHLLHASRALRDLTVHGLLSSVRVYYLGLEQEVLDQMLLGLGSFVLATYKAVLAARPKPKRKKRPRAAGAKRKP